MRISRQLVLVFIICLTSSVQGLKLNVPRLLLPYSSSVVNVSLEIIDAKSTDCFEWQSSASYIQLLPSDEDKICPKRVTLSAYSRAIARQEAVVSVHHKETKTTLFCDVITDVIKSIHIVHATSHIWLGGPPLAISISATNNEGHTFSTLNGIDVNWNVEHVSEGDIAKKSTSIVRFLECSEAAYSVPCISTVGHQKAFTSVLLVGVNVGSAVITASLKQPFYNDIDPVGMTLKVSSSAVLKPSDTVFILPGAQVDFHMETKYGQPIELSSYKLTVENSTIAYINDNSAVAGFHYGETNIIMNDEYGNVFSTHIHVVEPSYIGLRVHPGESWILHEATGYNIFVVFYDSDKNRIYQSANLRVKVKFPSKLFYVNSSTSDGIQHYVRALVPGSGVIKVQFLGIETKDGIVKMFDLNVSQKVVIYQAIQIRPSLLLLPSYMNTSAMYVIAFKATGGTGLYSWGSNIPAVKIQYEGDGNNAVIHFYEEGDFVIAVEDRNCSLFRSRAEVSVQPVAEIEVYATVVEAEIGNYIIVPVALLGFESKDKEVYRAFDDCSKVVVSVEVIEKHIISYKPDADVPPFGRGCLTLQFLCIHPGHSRINVLHQSEDRELKTTLVVACHKLLKPVHPARVAVLALGTSKEVAFEGGPRPWPLHKGGYYEKLVADIPELVNITIIKDPVRYNKDLHVFNVLCRDLGETVLKFFVGNEPSATNRNPSQMESSIKIVCNRPHSLHLAYKFSSMGKKVPIVPGKNIVKVPFYGNKLFEIDIWIKDVIGRKFANISSFSIAWEISDGSIANFVEKKDFLTHIDGSAGYRKVSRNFQQLEMTGKTGAVKVTATLTGYHKNVLVKEDISVESVMDNISQSIELELVSMRDLYGDAYNSIKSDNADENCDGDSCKA